MYPHVKIVSYVDIRGPKVGPVRCRNGRGADHLVAGSAAQRTDFVFEQVCGAAQAALRISRVVSDVVRAYGIAGGRYG